MEVIVTLGIIEADKGGRYHDFEVVAFYPGKQRNGGLGEGWKESRNDVSIMPVAHLIERSFNQDSMVVYKKPDFLSSQLMDAHTKQTQLSGIVQVFMRNGIGNKTVEVGDYSFDFQVNKILINQTNDEGSRWERMELKIIDKTERIMGLDE